MVLQKFEPVKASEDARCYRGLLLENGLKVILVSDPTTDKAGAALDVHVGHLSDPWEIPGLAHFLEHMLFMGTEKYPDENDYNQFLSLHGGSSNAYTDCDHTNFYFDVSPPHLSGALDRFAQFFLKPLFTESATEREMKAVNSENDKNLASDSWRLMQLERSMSKDGHAYGKFGTGNLDTLDAAPKTNGLNVRQELLKFHDQWYSSNIMALAVLGKQTLDELEALVLEHFDKVENKTVTLPQWPDHPYAEGGTLVHYMPVKDWRRMSMNFAIPDYGEHHLSKPVSYVSHLIGHEGKGSLLSELKALGYVNNLVAGLKPGAKGFDFFVVDVDLTETGIEKTDHIILLVFQYLAMLRKDGVQEWIFEECKLVNDMLFRFKDKEQPQNYVRYLANSLHDYPIDELLTGPWIIKDWRPDLIRDTLNRLVPENVYVTLVGRKFEPIANETEKWYGSKYSKEKFSADKLSAWSAAGHNEKLFLPKPNEFIPTDFEIVPRDMDHAGGKTAPSVLRDNQLCRLWFLQDNEFLLPKAIISLEIFSPLAYVDPLHANLTSMLVSTFNDSLTEFAYDAELAGLVYCLSPEKYGLFLEIRGYQQKQSVLLERIITNLKSFVVNKDRFEVLKEAYVRALKNFEMDQPHSHASYRSEVILSEKIWTKDELLESAQSDQLTTENLQQFVGQLLSCIKLEMLIHGNLTAQHALDISDMVEKHFGAQTRPLPGHAFVRNRIMDLGVRQPCYHQLENAVHKSSCIMLQLHVGLDATKDNMRTELYAQIIKEPFFNNLRTIEQLGYIVFSGVRKTGGLYGLNFLIQSHKKPRFLESRIEHFIKESRDMIKDMNVEEFARHKQALSDKRSEKPKKMFTRTDKMWREIRAHRYNFNRDDIEVTALSEITQQDLLDFFDTYVGASAPQRRKLSTHVISVVPNEDSEEEVANDVKDSVDCGHEVSNIHQYKTRLGLHPLVQPFVDLTTLKRT